MDPAQSAAAITAILDALKRARDVAKRLKDVGVQEILVDAHERAVSLKEALVDLRNENLELREQLAAKDAVTFDRGGYWSNNAGQRDGPFCSRCLDVDKQLVRLKPTFGHHHQCPSCNQVFEVLSAPPRPDSPPLRMRLPRED